MMPYHCPCGQRIDAGIEPDDVAYRITFRVADAGPGHWPVTHCPSCDRDLGQMLIQGQLEDVTCQAQENTPWVI